MFFGYSLGLSGLLDLAERVNRNIKYWQDRRDERLRLVQFTHQPSGPDREIVEVAYVIDGTVDDVQSYPPGLLFENVKEWVSQRRLKSIPAPERNIVERSPPDRCTQYNKKFVAFRDIDQIHFPNEGE